MVPSSFGCYSERVAYCRGCDTSRFTPTAASVLWPLCHKFGDLAAFRAVGVRSISGADGILVSPTQCHPPGWITAAPRAAEPNREVRFGDPRMSTARLFVGFRQLRSRRHGA